jgi:hypothetical protein
MPRSSPGTPPSVGEAAAVLPPTESKVFLKATAATVQRFKIPDDWKGKYVTITVAGEDVDLLFGGSTVDVTLNQVSTVASEAITYHAKTGERFFAGQSRNVVVAADKTHFAYIAAGATGYVRVHASSP